ncbi:hypothetical protein O181_047477 [Austropuccinia psidii MF-1]|uniref:Spp2/MOS2 G-patch domain-containing protein n=1 Tax=Austropuccinia psidii MF-1 TaxID=1389203 RepID=A0A9Q3HKP0_9BASI|nr:hypothetical protein [Austropuccinia psidii MF-1]
MSSLSFKIQRPLASSKKPASHHTHGKNSRNQFDSSDEDESISNSHSSKSNKRSIQLITDFDYARDSISDQKDPANQLSIPLLPDRDFRAIHFARKQKRAKKAIYKPDPLNPLGDSDKNAKTVAMDAEGVDKMNSQTIQGGLKTHSTVKQSTADRSANENQIDSAAKEASTPLEALDNLVSPKSLEASEPETLDQKALRELLSQANEQSNQPKPIEPILMPPQQAQSESDDQSDPGDETEQFRREVSKLPDSSTLDDYHRVPVGQFGLALLKGMGWQEGTSTSKRGRVGLAEAYVPKPRPNLLGIGAKPLVLDPDSTASNSTQTRGKPSKPDKTKLSKYHNNK